MFITFDNFTKIEKGFMLSENKEIIEEYFDWYEARFTTWNETGKKTLMKKFKLQEEVVDQLKSIFIEEYKLGKN